MSLRKNLLSLTAALTIGISIPLVQVAPAQAATLNGCAAGNGCMWVDAGYSNTSVSFYYCYQSLSSSMDNQASSLVSNGNSYGTIFATLPNYGGTVLTVPRATSYSNLGSISRGTGTWGDVISSARFSGSLPSACTDDVY